MFKRLDRDEKERAFDVNQECDRLYVSEKTNYACYEGTFRTELDILAEQREGVVTEEEAGKELDELRAHRELYWKAEDNAKDCRHKKVEEFGAEMKNRGMRKGIIGGVIGGIAGTVAFALIKDTLKTALENLVR
jgi:hypothetical protein